MSSALLQHLFEQKEAALTVGATVSQSGSYNSLPYAQTHRTCAACNPLDELIDDAAHSVYRYGEAKARGRERVAGGGSVNADQAAAAVQQRATRVSCKNPGLGGRGGGRDDGRGCER